MSKRFFLMLLILLQAGASSGQMRMAMPDTGDPVPPEQLPAPQRIEGVGNPQEIFRTDIAFSILDVAQKAFADFGSLCKLILGETLCFADLANSVACTRH